MILLVSILGGCASFDPKGTLDDKTLPEGVHQRLELAREIQVYEKKLGFMPDDNFKRFNKDLSVYTICYSAPLFELSTVMEETVGKCSPEEQKKDFIEYKAAAIAGIGGTPLGVGLLHAPLPYFIMTIFHEDFHEQMVGVPSQAIDESAATLIGLLAARDFARMHHGVASLTYRTLDLTIASHLEVAVLEASYRDRLQELYTRVKKGETSETDALVQKTHLYSEMRRACTSIVVGVLATCRDIKNNADFGVQLRYSSYVPLFYDLYHTCRNNTASTAEILSDLAHEKQSEEEYISRVKRYTSKELTCP